MSFQIRNKKKMYLFLMDFIAVLILTSEWVFVGQTPDDGV